MRSDKLVAFNPYYVNGHSPCRGAARRAIKGSLFDLGKQPNAMRQTGRISPTSDLKEIHLRGEAGHGEAVMDGGRGSPSERPPAQHTKSPLRLRLAQPALLHKGRVLFVCKEAYLDVVTKFTNSLTKGGNQQKAEGVLRRCRMFIKIKGKKTSKFSYQAIQNVKPLVELKNQPKSKGSRRKQKSTPAPISQKRGIKSAIQRIIEGARKRPERTMALRLYLELLNAYNKKGYAMKKKTDLHNQCQVSFFHAGASKESPRGGNFIAGSSAPSAP
jgi:small subunit ribosomal protein S7